MRILITSGGTTIPIDAVRKITNMSKGTFGSQICESFVSDYTKKRMCGFDEDIDVTFLTNVNGRLPQCVGNIKPIINKQIIVNPKEGVTIRCVGFDTFDQYQNILFQLLDSVEYDCVILAAAVSDYGIDQSSYTSGKVRSTAEQMTIKLIKLPKLISFVREKQQKCTLVGFKLLVGSTVDELKSNCVKSIEDNKLDLIVGNDLRDIKCDNHTLMIGTRFLGCNFNTPEHICFEQYSKKQAIEDNQTLSDYLVDVIHEVHHIKNRLMMFPDFHNDCFNECGNLINNKGINWCERIRDFCQADTCPVYAWLIKNYKSQFNRDCTKKD